MNHDSSPRAVSVRVLARNKVHNTTVLAGTDLYAALIELGIINRRAQLYHQDMLIDRDIKLEDNSFVTALFPGEHLVRVTIGEYQGFQRESFVPHTTTIGALSRYTCVPFRNSMRILDQYGIGIVDDEAVQDGSAYLLPIHANKSYHFQYDPKARPKSI